jgi:hypothetical protein
MAHPCPRHRAGNGASVAARRGAPSAKMHRVSATGTPSGRGERRGRGRVALRVLYWLAVVAISLALVVALVLFLEARDDGAVGTSLAPR